MTTALQDHLIELVKASHIPQTDLAHTARMSEKHASQMLTGKVEGSLDAWQRLLDAAGVQLTPEIYRNGQRIRPAETGGGR